MIYTLNIEPKPQSRPRLGRYVTYEERTMKRWKWTCQQQLALLKPNLLEKGALYVGLTFYIYPPKRLATVKKHRLALETESIYVDKRPDIENYVKAVLDASNGILYKDDGQIAALSTQKLYSLQPRIELEIYPLGFTKTR